MGAPMKGLTQFIADIRNSTAQEEEDRRINVELVNIQKQFLATGLSGYQRKKYVCKLIYIYILGHKLTFGYMELIQLMASKVYSEKEIGYLAITVLFNETHEMMTLVINSVKSDLTVENYDFNCLALQAISAIANEEWAQNLGEFVFLLLRSPATPPFVRKKAALALLRLIKVSPSVYFRYQLSWLPRIIALVDLNDRSFGLALATMELVSHIAKISLGALTLTVPIIIRKLNRLVIDNDCPNEYLYYHVPDPWLTVKLLSFVEDLILILNEEAGYSVANIDEASLGKLRSVVSKAIENGRRKATSPQQHNAQSAILFALVSLATRLDPSLDAISGAIDALSTLLASRETNTRYLALNSLIKIISGGSFINGKSDIMNMQNAMKRHSPEILELLKDKDVSVRQKSLELLFLICDDQNLEPVMNEVLVYLGNSDYLIRNSVSLRIYLLTEKFAKNLTWYVVTSLKIITIAGNYVDDEIWKGFIKTVCNSTNKNFKTYACKSTLKYLQTNSIGDPVVKIAAFLLGEYGDLITADDESCSAWNQFSTLYDCYLSLNLSTRYMILSCFLKFYKHYPDLRQTISKFYRNELNSINSEIQQRAVEYIKITSATNVGLLDLVVLEMPEFKIGKKLILDRLEKRGDTFDSDLLDLKDTLKTAQTVLSPNMNGSYNPFDNSDDEVNSDDEFILKPTKIMLSPNWELGFKIFRFANSGTLFENSLIKIECVLTSQNLKLGKKIDVLVKFYNKSPADMSSFITTVKLNKTTDPPIIVKSINLPDSNIPTNENTSMQLEATIRSPFEESDAPVLEINFLSGAFTSLKLKLPIILTKAISSTSLSYEHFSLRWTQLEAANNLELVAKQTLELSQLTPLYSRVDNIQRMLSRMGWGQCKDESGQKVLLFAGIVNAKSGNSGTLLKLQFYESSFDLTVRSTASIIPNAINDTLTSILKG